MSLNKIRAALNDLADKKYALQVQRYFKTEAGEYAFGDIFIGIRVADLRKLALYYQDLSAANGVKLLKSPIHEQRMLALLILTRQYQTSHLEQQQKIVNLYLKHTKYINNWDLVDVAAYKILGAHLLKKNKSLLTTLATSTLLWERRIAMVSTYYFIQQDVYSPTLKLAKMLLRDEHDRIHKAVGWMLRELGNKDRQCELDFLAKYAHKMPRTMLRVASEKLPLQQRQFWLAI